MATPVYESYLLGENQAATKENVALFEAALKGNYEEVKVLLKNGAKPNFFHHPEDQKNALHVAAENGYSDIVDVLLQHGAVVNSIAAKDQSTALILAAQNGHLKVVQLLLSHGANVEAANGYGNTALHEAAHSGSLPLIEVLLRADAAVNAENHKGSTPLHTFCYGEDRSKHSVEGIRLLVDSGANVNARDHRAMTPLLVCCASGRDDFVDFLLRNGASISVKDAEGRDAHAIAAFYRNESISKILDNHFHK